jgi:long-chain fatty acid transport protein
MKKIAVLIAGAFLLANLAYAGGILTNTNQSAQFVRMLSRNASTDLDAVYFNPAGLTQLENGFYFGLHNQSIFQNRTIESGFKPLNDSIYKGEVLAPVFPSAFAVYKLNNWAFSAGFGPNGGGGSAKYSKGLPSFEKLISSIPAGLNSSRIPTSEYSSNIQFEGSSVFWGAQLNGSYAINDVISVSAGVRVIMANNTYNGYLKDIKINPNQPAFGAAYSGEMVSATEFFAAGNNFMKGMATNSTAVSTGLTNAISGGTPAATPLSALPAATVSAVTQLLGAAGISATGMNIGTAAATLTAVAAGFNGTATTMETNSIATADKTVDTKQTGTGFTPIVGIDIHLDKLNIGLKYEHQTVLKLTNATVVDGTGLFTDGEESRSDLPSVIAAGADYMATDKLKLSGSFTMFLDKNIGWGGNVYKQERTIDNNFIEMALGLEYKLNDNFALSAGYMNSNTGVSEQYQSDFSYSNDSYTAGLGFQWNINDRLVLDAGAMLTTYKDATKTFDASFDELAEKFGPYNETYGKDTFAFAFGIGYQIMEFKSRRRR